MQNQEENEKSYKKEHKSNAKKDMVGVKLFAPKLNERKAL